MKPYPIFGSLFAFLQKMGQALMVPVSVLPAAGLLVAGGRLLQNIPAHFPAHGPLLSLGQVFYSGGLALFEHLPLIFSIGVALGFSSGAGVAALAAAVCYFSFGAVLKSISEIRELASPINAGVFGGLVCGLVSAFFYRRYHQTRLPPFLGFFAGKRLVPILTAAVGVFVALGFGFIWPPVQEAIAAFGRYVVNSPWGPGFYAAGKRLLIPIGLHHVYYPSFLFEFGEYVNAAGQTLRGESARYFAGDPSAGSFMAAEFPLMLFGLPAAAWAITLRAKATERAAIAGVMLSAALTSIITGITEPIEFAFIFVAPLLYVCHVLLAFLSGVLTHFFQIHLGYTFSASAIDFALGFFNQQNSSRLFLVVGPLIGCLYFAVFYILIGLFNFKTPGREDEAATSVTLDPSSALTGEARQDPRGARSVPQERSPQALAAPVLAAFGGAANIIALDACITRLRVTVKSSQQVDKQRLKSLGAVGVLDAGHGNFQAVFGTLSDALKECIAPLLSNAAPATPAPASKSITPLVNSHQAKADTAATSHQQKNLVLVPIRGTYAPLSAVPDKTFSQKILGDGLAVTPTEGIVYSPVSGTVAQVFRTQHALGITTEEGIEILIHVGIDTVKLGGEGFKALVQAGESVTAGQKLLEFDLELIKQKAPSLMTPIVVTGLGDYAGFHPKAEGTCAPGEVLFEFYRS